MQDKPLLWTQNSVAATTNGTLTHAFQSTGVSIDSRDLQKGDIFVALRSDRDGHYFVRNALEKGASAALVVWRPKGLPRNAPLVFVRNSLHALVSMGKAARARSTAKIIAVTGSSGKTSTKEMLNHVLQDFGMTHASKASFNNHWGVPVSLANMPVESEYGVFELGMNKTGEIDNLVKMVCPHIAIITTVGNAHRGFFETEDSIAKAKAEIFNGLQQGGLAILNKDNPHYDLLKQIATEKNIQTVCFGEHNDFLGDSAGDADAVLLDYQYDSNVGLSTCQVKIQGETFTVKSGFMGKHQAMNALAVLLVAHHLKLDMQKAVDALQSFTPVAGRGQSFTLQLGDDKTAILLDESYNANPLSMQASFEVLKNYPATSKKRLILADMKELGTESQKLHEDLADNADACSDIVYLIGYEVKYLAQKLEEKGKTVLYFEHVRNAIDSVLNDVQAGDVLLLKGSNSMRLSLLVEQAVKRFSNPIIPHEDCEATCDVEL